MSPKKKTNEEFEVLFTSTTSSDDIYISPPTGTFTNVIDTQEKIMASESYETLQKEYDVIGYTIKAKKYIKKNSDEDQVKQLQKLLNDLINNLIGYENVNLPLIRISLSEDKSIALSWHIGNAYFGAAIQKDISKSSWFLIQGGTRGYKADGYLDDPNFKKQLPSIFNLLIKSFIEAG
jgi:hypothetical protein